MGRFRTILFDADNTLFDFKACEKEALRLAFEKYEYPLNQEITETYERINHDLWKQFEQGIIDRNTVIYTRFGKLFEEIGIDDDGIAFEEDYQELLGMQHFFVDGAFQIVKDLYKRFDLYIVTNGVTATQLRRLKESCVDRYMKKIFVSEETGYQKPMKEYFDYCFDRIEHFRKEDAIIIGDSLSSDIKGGNNAGISTCWFNPDGLVNSTDVKADYEIRDLKELYQILGYELIISGYGTKPEKTIRHYSVYDNVAEELWADSIENSSFVCSGYTIDKGSDTISEDGYLFTVTEVSEYAVVYLYRKQEKGYQLLDQIRLEGGSLCHITYSPVNKALFGACYETGTIFSIRVEEDKFGELLYQEMQQGEDPKAITRAHFVSLNRAETELITVNIALDRIYYYAVQEGRLTLKQIPELPKGIGPRHAILSEDESLIYIITEYSNEILIYTNEPEIKLVQRISTLPEGFAGKSNCSTLCLSKDGSFLYAANRGAETIALFAVGMDGTLDRIGEYDCGGKHPRHMIITKDGRNLIVCNQNSDNVTVFSLDARSGALKQEISFSFPAPSGVVEI